MKAHDDAPAGRGSEPTIAAQLAAAVVLAALTYLFTVAIFSL